MNWLRMIITLAVLGGIVSYPTTGNANAEFIVYSVYKGVDLGNPDDVPLKDFYVNMGSVNGVRNGSTLEVLRRTASYDLANQKLYKDVTFPIAKLKVIHVEPNAAIARLEGMLPAEKRPAITPSTVIVGDIVRLAD